MIVRIPIGANDRNGVPIHLGDRLRLDVEKWGEPHEFTAELRPARILHDGDLSEWCEVIASPGWEVPDAPFDEASGRTAEAHVHNIVRVLASRYRRKRRRVPLWADVCDVFATGSTSAHEICRRCGYDPDTGEELAGGEA